VCGLIAREFNEEPKHSIALDRSAKDDVREAIEKYQELISALSGTIKKSYADCHCERNAIKRIPWRSAFSRRRENELQVTL
jgi:hypothetical protein